MQRFESLLDAASRLFRSGYQYNDDYGRFERGSWYAYIRLQKNGRVKVEWL